MRIVSLKWYNPPAVPSDWYSRMYRIERLGKSCRASLTKGAKTASSSARYWLAHGNGMRREDAQNPMRRTSCRPTTLESAWIPCQMMARPARLPISRALVQ